MVWGFLTDKYVGEFPEQMSSWVFPSHQPTCREGKLYILNPPRSDLEMVLLSVAYCLYDLTYLLIDNIMTG